MFAKRQRDREYKVTTLIGEDIILKEGILYAQNTIRIDGQYKGEIDSKGEIIIGSNGIVEGNIQCKNIIISGKIKGNISASGQVHIQNTGSVKGDISCLTIAIDEGGIFIGKCIITKKGMDKTDLMPDAKPS